MERIKDFLWMLYFAVLIIPFCLACKLFGVELDD